MARSNDLKVKVQTTMPGFRPTPSVNSRRQAGPWQWPKVV